jgi:putative Holliday junction resolvase
MGRALALDYGVRRIGLALSDPSFAIASPFGTLTRRAGKRPPWAELERLVHEKEVVAIVVGLPLDLAGNETDWSAEVREFAAALERRTGIEVHLLDERLTSVQAERVVHTSGLRSSQRKEKERVDETAAAILLQSYLQRSYPGSDAVSS